MMSDRRTTPFVPAVLITDILTRLPPLSLLRFSCVSKSWCSEIDDPRFIKLHLRHSLQTPSSLSLILHKSHFHLVRDLQLPNHSASIIPNPFPGDGLFYIQFIGSCNGLLVIYYSWQKIALWNPCTRKQRILPNLAMEHDPGNTVHHGFGYDSLHDDYKLIRITRFISGVDSDIRVYSLNSGSWRQIRDFPYYIVHETACGVLAKEALHWLVNRNRWDEQKLIVAFDLRYEEYRELELPDCGSSDGFISNLVVLAGQLCLGYQNYTDGCTDLWLMNEYGVKDSWGRLFRLTLPGIRVPEIVSPLVYSEHGNRVLSIFDDWPNMVKKFAWFDLEGKTAEIVTVRDAPASFCHQTFVDSLVAVTRRGGNRRTELNKGKKKRRRKMK